MYAKAKYAEALQLREQELSKLPHGEATTKLEQALIAAGLIDASLSQQQQQQQQLTVSQTAQVTKEQSWQTDYKDEAQVKFNRAKCLAANKYVSPYTIITCAC
jgi:hypothetical protein